MSDDVTVIQVDRNFAADYQLARGRINQNDHERICQGIWDDTDDVKAVARFRLSLSTPSPDSGERMREALTPSGDTKAAYMGEFKFDVMFPSLDEDDDEPVPHPVTVPWDTIKEIMAAIAGRAALQESAR